MSRIERAHVKSAKTVGLLKCPTGIRGLDEITEGGLSQGGSTQSKDMTAKVSKTESRPARSKRGEAAVPEWELRLYVAGMTPRALTAFKNLKKICEEHLAGQYSIEIIDLTKDPQLALGDQIVAVPTLVRKLPEPVRKIIGDLSNTERVLVGLDLRPKQ